MRFFTGQYERSIDPKGRIQLPAQLRAAIDPKRDGSGLYVQLGDFHGTLALYTERGFEELADRMVTEQIPGAESRKFELQFYALASFVDLDNQGRFVVPDALRAKARLKDDVLLIGQKNRIDVWNPENLKRVMGIDWEGDDWPDWQGFLRMKSQQPWVNTGGRNPPEMTGS